MSALSAAVGNLTSGFDLLSYFQEEQENDLLALAQPRTINARETLIAEGQVSPGLFIVTRGLFDVRVGAQQPTSVGKRGPGDLLGEVSFLTGEGANATVAALETSEVLALPAETLQAHLQMNASFAARFYRVLARVVARKLTEQSRRAMPFTVAITHSPELDARLRGGIHQIKAGISEVEASLARGKSLDDDRRRLQEILNGAMDFLNSLFKSEAELPPALHQDVAAYLRQELLPLVLLGQICERSYTKPRGYAGDFQVIDMLYSNKPAGMGRLGPLLDEYFLNIAVAKAVRNRRGLLLEVFLEVLAEKPADKVHITSLACGPAREVFDLFDRLDDPKQVMVHCLDLDFQALSAVSRTAEQRGVERSIQLLQENLILLATGRRKTSLPPQRLMYSIGLIDYFQDKLVIQLMNWIYDTLASGGLTVLGNFAPGSPDRPFMDHLLEWRLIYRTPDDMRRLFAASKFGDTPVDIRFEQEGINLFASCRKQG
jgi:CRP-like cAMP-binding protein